VEKCAVGGQEISHQSLGVRELGDQAKKTTGSLGSQSIINQCSTRLWKWILDSDPPGLTRNQIHESESSVLSDLPLIVRLCESHLFQPVLGGSTECTLELRATLPLEESKLREKASKVEICTEKRLVTRLQAAGHPG
jgi:hypothetical protein